LLAYSRDGGSGNQTRQFTYANPFGEDTFALLSAGFVHDVALQGAQPHAFATGTAHSVLAPPDCSTTVILGGSAAIPGKPRIDGADIPDIPATTAQITFDRTRPAMIDAPIPPAGAGAVDVWTLAVYELTVVSGTTTATNVRTYVTAEPPFRVDPAVFEVGSYYLLEVYTSAGYPNAASGDFTTVQWPLSGAVVQSPPFQAR
jgi:hypothetical protein